jgi:hypothetical protein
MGVGPDGLPDAVRGLGGGGIFLIYNKDTDEIPLQCLIDF